MSQLNLILPLLLSIIVVTVSNAFDLTWSSTAHQYGLLPEPRAYQQIAVSTSNNIYLFGGNYEAISLSIDYYKTDVWKWNQQSLIWDTLTQTQTDLIKFNGCNIPNATKTDCGWQGISQSECEDISGCCWSENTPHAAIPYCYYYDNVIDYSPSFWSYSRSVAVINNLVYFIGIAHNGGNNNPQVKDGRIFVFDMTTDKFISHSINPMPVTSMYGCTANYNDESIFYVGGKLTSGSYTFALVALNILSNEWIIKASCPVAYMTHACEIVNDKLFQFGGWDGLYAKDSIYKYDIIIDYWTPQSIGSLTEGKDTLRTIFSADKQFIYIFGGWMAYHSVTDTIDVFDVNSETIVTTYKLPQSEASATLALIQNRILIFGGYYIFSNPSGRESMETILISNIITPTPTTYPTSNPTSQPTEITTNTPTNNPTINPTFQPTQIPTNTPTNYPTIYPTINPTIYPTDMTIEPSINPTYKPTDSPSNIPTISPSNNPTKIPSPSPTYNEGVQNDEITTQFINTNINLNTNNNENWYLMLILIVIGIIMIILLCIICLIFCIIRRKKLQKKEEKMIHKHSHDQNELELQTTKGNTKGYDTPQVKTLDNKLVSSSNGETEDVSDSERLYTSNTNNIVTPNGDVDNNNNNNNNNITPGINDMDNKVTPGIDNNHDNNDLYEAQMAITRGENDEMKQNIIVTTDY